MSAAANGESYARRGAVPPPSGEPGPNRVAGLTYALSGGDRGPVVLFLHGFMGSSEDWREVAAALEDRFRCLAVDLPGHGASLGLPPESYTVEGAARMLLELLDKLGVERCAVVGYSMGGRLALYFALRYPERCGELFVESASPGLESAAEREARREADEEKASWLESGSLEEFLENWYRQPLFASLTRRERLLKGLIESRRKNDSGELAKSLRGMGTGSQPSLWGKLGSLRVPALAIAGELDEKFVGIAQKMAGLSLRICVEVLPEAGHNPRLEAPQAYLASLRSFLDVS